MAREAQHPNPKDIVVCTEQRGHVTVYVRKTHEGENPHLHYDRQFAYAAAIRAAIERHVGAWATENGIDFLPLIPVEWAQWSPEHRP